MKPVPFILALFLAESLGFPQVPPTGQDATALPDPSTGLVSPWSQWMSLKAPPISLAKPKKKLLPGPPPPEGTPEAPWVTWTRMKVSTALAPPVPPPPPPSSPVSSEGGVSSTTGNASAPEQAVWIQWTQMKLPLASPLAPASPAQETPWDAWTKLKSPIAQVQSPPVSELSVSKRMAPDRYSIASTIAPRVITWPPQQQTSSSSEQGSGRVLPPLRPAFLDAVRPNQPSSSVSARPTTESDLPTNLAALVESTPELARLPPKIRNQVLEELGLLSQSSPIPTTTSSVPRVPSRQLTTKPEISAVLSALPPPVLKQLLATTSPAEVEKLIEAIADSSVVNIKEKNPPVAAAAPAVLSIIPEPVRSQILVKATTTELAQIVEVLSKLEEVTPEERPLVENVDVGTILPASLVQKLPPAVVALLTKKLEIPSVPPTVLLSSSIPEPILSTILSVANPLEVVELTENLKKVESLAPVSTPPIAAILPSTLAAKLPPQLGPVLEKIKPEKMPVPTAVAPPTEIIAAVLAALPAPVLKDVLDEATPAELSKVVENLAKLKEVKPAPKIPVFALLPPSLIPKLSPALAPLLTKEVILSPLPPSPVEVPVEVLSVLSSIPEPLLKEILTAATSEELIQLLETISSVQSPVPEKKPISALIPPSLFAKLPGPVTPLVNIPVEIPAKPITPNLEVVQEDAIPALLSILPESVVPVILSKATPEELAELINTVAKLEAVAPDVKPLISNLEVATILPPSLLAKLPPAVTPLLEKKIDVGALISPELEKLPQSATSPIPESTASVLSILPPSLIPQIIVEATPEELKELVDRVEKLEALPEDEKALISKVEVAAILPPSLLPKLSPALAPLLAKTIDVADLTLPATEVNNIAPAAVPLVPAATAFILSILPPPLVPQIIAEATPEELTELVERVEKLEALPEDEKVLISKVEVAAILPPSLLPKLSPALAPLLAKTIDVADLTLPVTEVKITPAAVPLVPAATAAILSILPPPLIPQIIAEATPEELSELVERVEKLKAIPEEEKALLPTVEVAAILPPSLIAKLPVEATPLLKKGVTISELPSTIPPPPPVSAAVVPPSLLDVLSVLPAPVVPEILAKATPEELTELTTTITQLESIPEEQKQLLPKIQAADVLPPTLLAKLSPETLPLLGKEVVITPPAASTTVPANAPIVAVAPTPLPAALPAAVRPLLPKPIVPEILAKATPDELTELISTVEALEAIPPEALPKLTLGNILPPTLIPKLSPEVLPLLSKEVPIPSPELATAIVPVPEAEAVPPELKSIPEPLLSTILAVATPAELEEIEKIVQKIEAIPPEQKAVLPKLPIASVLPATLLSKLPPTVAPLLSLELIPPNTIQIPVVVPVLQAVPEPLLSEILAVASPSEVEQIVETLTELEELPPQQKALLPKPLTITAILPPSLIAKLPSEIVPLVNKDVIPEAIQVTPEAVAAPPSVPPAAPLPDTGEAPWLEYLKSIYGIPETPPEVITQAPPVQPTEAPPTKAEEKLLTKWAKIILDKTGKPAVIVPGEIPPLQAAWMEWIQLQMNETKKAEATTSEPPVLPVSSEESTTEYPWTKWLKLKSSTPPTPLAIGPVAPVPPLDVGTESPEKATLDWLEALEQTQETPVVVPPPQITPEVEEKVEELLKQLGIENVPLPPDQIQALVSALATGAAPPVLPPVASEVVPPPSASLPLPPSVPVAPSLVPPPFPPAAYPAYLPPSSPFYPLVPRPFWAQPPYMPAYMGVPPPNPLVPVETAPSPVNEVPEAPSAVNLTQYLIANKLIPAGLPPSAPLPIPALVETTEANSSETKEVVESTPRTITSQELAALTPTKFAALLKQILKDCNNTNILVTRSSRSKGKGGAGAGGGFNWMAVKNKYKPSIAGPPPGVMKSKRALLPIPSQGVSAPPPQLESSSSKDLLPLPSLSMPKVETAGTVLDPAYWAAQKSMFLSKLFSTLAKVALNDSAAQQETSTLSPKEQLTKQVNRLLLNSMTRSIKHQQESEEEDEYEGSDEDQQNVDENELVTNDNSEPNLPKEPENPLHKLFKFGVQKTVLSDLSTPPPEPQPIYVYVTSPPPPLETVTRPNLDKQKEILNKLKKVYGENKKLKKKIKSKNRKYKSKPSTSSKSTGGSNTHHHSRNHPFRKTTTPATTESPVDFELLAKALLVDNKAKK
ncbi:unnamed protein product [Orchesella dallaii]|uniref:Uncharacterized protein n=1 Tax=Orchesella dallaii TaxID=48710 RepID=A0ABP1PLX2_9HEXA